VRDRRARGARSDDENPVRMHPPQSPRSLVAALDQGTTSTRCILFDRDGRPVAEHRVEHAQLFPRPGWVEHDAAEIWARAQECLAGVGLDRVAAIGVTNQRETTIVWERASGRPAAPAIVWQDTRTEERATAFGRLYGLWGLAERTGLPFSSYSSALKLAWLLDADPDLRRAGERGEVLFGTPDSWLVWNLTGVHATDATNASRTMLMDLRTLSWDPELLDLFGVPAAMLPEIRSSSEVIGTHQGVPIAGILGDQQAALFGHACFAPGESKATYGTGCFLLMHTGTEPARSRHGLITTVAATIAGEPATYALEGSVAVAGALVQWLRDNLGLIRSADEIEALAASVPDAGGVVVVPAFSGLYAPHWRGDARGVVAGLTRFSSRAHLARAALEATAYQAAELVTAMTADTGLEPPVLRADGGMTANDLLMQIQADVLGIPVATLPLADVTALGAAYAAGLAVGFWSGPDELRAHHGEARRWEPRWDEAARAAGLARWRKGVDRSLGWA